MLNRKAIISAGLCAATLMISNPAFAQVRSVAVKVNDLNLATPSGQAQLEKRISSAARSVCSTDSRTVRDLVAAQKCEARAIARAEPKIANRIAEYKSQRGIAIRTDLKLASD